MRGWILKRLVEGGKLNVEKLLLMENIQEEFPGKDVENIVMGMVKDGLVDVFEGKIEIRG